MESAFGVDHGVVSKALPGLKMPKVGRMFGQSKPKNTMKPTGNPGLEGGMQRSAQRTAGFQANGPKLRPLGGGTPGNQPNFGQMNRQAAAGRRWDKFQTRSGSGAAYGSRSGIN